MFIAKFGILRHTAADATDDTIFAMRNAGASINTGREIHIRRIILSAAFDGTSAATHTGYGLTRFTTATASGGSSPVRVNTNPVGSGGSVITDANIQTVTTATKLTITSMVFEGNFHEMMIANQVAGGVQTQILEFNLKPFILRQGEGIACRLAFTAVIGLGCSGSIWWDEVNI